MKPYEIKAELGCMNKTVDFLGRETTIKTIHFYNLLNDKCILYVLSWGAYAVPDGINVKRWNKTIDKMITKNILENAVRYMG